MLILIRDGQRRRLDYGGSPCAVLCGGGAPHEKENGLNSGLGIIVHCPDLHPVPAGHLKDLRYVSSVDSLDVKPGSSRRKKHQKGCPAGT